MATKIKKTAEMKTALLPEKFFNQAIALLILQIVLLLVTQHYEGFMMTIPFYPLIAFILYLIFDFKMNTKSEQITSVKAD
jgi:hypothetical protein